MCEVLVDCRRGAGRADDVREARAEGRGEVKAHEEAVAVCVDGSVVEEGRGGGVCCEGEGVCPCEGHGCEEGEDEFGRHFLARLWCFFNGCL